MTNLEKKPKLILNKAGTALKYGLTVELPEIIQDQNLDGAYNLYACLTYFCLHNIIVPKRIASISRQLYVNSLRPGVLEEVVERITKTLILEFVYKYDFKDLDTLCDSLDQYTIPQWCFAIGSEYMSTYIENMILVNGDLFFIEGHSFGSAYTLRRIGVNQLKEGSSLVVNSEADILAYGCNEIASYDSQYNRIYLYLYGLQDFYGYYDIFTKTVGICKGRLYEVSFGNLFVVTRDDYLARIVGNTEKKICPYDEETVYECKNGYIFVRPNGILHRFFEPYNLLFDGSKEAAAKELREHVLWRYITFGFYLSNLTASDKSMKFRKLIYPKLYTLKGMTEAIDAFVPKKRRSKDKCYVVLMKIFELLNGYVEADTDITDLMFVLGEANSLLSSSRGFPSEKLYFKLREIEIVDANSEMSLGNLIMSHEYKKLLDILTSDNQEHDNQGMEIDEEEIVPLKGMIGTFMMRKKGVATTPIMLEDGMFIGNMILPQVNTMSTTGIVAFDAGAGVHYVICEKDMSLPDKSHILEAFGLDSERTIFVKQSIKPKKNKNIQKQE